ncbi:MAG: P-loop NTPase fold protein [Chloroflexota bacterium]
MTDAKHRLLPDNPLASNADRALSQHPNRDQFRVHTAYASTLRELIELSPTPFSIGLLGPWGSGKTHVLGLLQEQLSQSHIPHIYLDVWKFARDPVKRWVLLETERQLGLENFRFEGRSLKSLLESDYSITEELAPRWSIPAWLSPLLLIVSTIILLTLYFSPLPPFATPLTVVISTLSASITATSFSLITISPTLRLISQGLATVFTKSRSSTERTLAQFSPEQFERLFKNLVDTALTNCKESVSGTNRLVVMFDNIDRVQEDSIVEILATIKTYLEIPHCIYIIACDQEALIRQLGATYSLSQLSIVPDHPPGVSSNISPNTFLQKVFQTTIALPPFLTSDIEHYLDALVVEAHAADIITTRVKDIALVAYDNPSPRRIKRFINDLLSYYTLGQSLESLDVVHKKTFTGRLDQLAKMVILRQEWPLVASRLQHAPELLTEWTESVRSGQTVLDDAAFSRFLRATQDIEIDGDISPFLHFKYSEHTKNQQFARTIITLAETADIVALLDQINDDDIRSEHAIRILLDEVRRSTHLDTIRSNNILRSVLDLKVAVPSRLSHHYDAVVFSRLESIPDDILHVSLSPASVLGSLSSASDWHRRMILGRYCRQLANTGETAVHKNARIRVLASVPWVVRDDTGLVQDALVTLLTGDRELFWECWADAGDVLTDSGFVSTELARLIIADVACWGWIDPDAMEAGIPQRTSYDSWDDVRFHAAQRIAELGPEESRCLLGTRLIDAATPGRGDGVDAFAQYAIRCLSALDCSRLDNAKHGTLAEALIACVATIAPSFSAPWLSPLLGIAMQLHKAAGDSIRSALMSHLDSLDSVQIIELIGAAGESGANWLFSHADAMSALCRAAQGRRARNSSSFRSAETNLLVALATKARVRDLLAFVDPSTPESLEALIDTVRLLKDNGQWRINEIDEMIANLLNRFIVSDVGARAESIVELAQILASSPQRGEVEAIAITADAGQALLQYAPGRGRDVLLTIKPHVTDAQARRVFEQTSDLVRQRPGHPYSLWPPTHLDVLAAYQDRATMESLDAVSRMLSPMFGPGQPNNTVTAALSVLTILTHVPVTADSVATDLNRLQIEEELRPQIDTVRATRVGHAG